jgi:8-oxo-dGTP pyrophosphatase MutT (NUDIX family)
MSSLWKPSVTVAAVIERDGRFLLVEEETSEGVRLNQPAGHLDPAETLVAACARETLEETAFRFTPRHLIGVYMWRHLAGGGALATTYVRFTFGGDLGEFESGRPLDHGILRTLWLTLDELRARSAEHRSPLVLQCVEDHVRGRRFPLELVYTHASALHV